MAQPEITHCFFSHTLRSGRSSIGHAGPAGCVASDIGPVAVDLDTENSSWSNLPVETELSADEAALGLPDPIGPSPGHSPLESAQP